MGIDYPAAHSMDTEWFAIDKDGRVAIMDSSEPGAVPALFLKTLEQGYHGEQLLEEISKATGAVLLFEKDEPQAESVGVYRYECSEGFGSEDEEAFDEEALPLYERIRVPTTPVTISDLPADLARKVQLIKFDSISFNESHLLQPIQFMRCEIWGDYERIYDSDGTVQPIPSEHISLGEPTAEPQQPRQSDNRPWWQKLFGGQ